nr:YkgJ family cysteine cluster protein [Thalassotalea piscium]
MHIEATTSIILSLDYYYLRYPQSHTACLLPLSTRFIAKKYTILLFQLHLINKDNLIISTQPTSEVCTKCGTCCKNFPFVRMTKEDTDRLIEFTKLSLDQIGYSDQNEKPGYFLQFKDNGECKFLTSSNGNFYCSVYQARPALCRSYPKEESQYKVCSENIIKLGLIDLST